MSGKYPLRNVGVNKMWSMGCLPILVVLALPGQRYLEERNVVRESARTWKNTKSGSNPQQTVALTKCGPLAVGPYCWGPIASMLCVVVG